MPTNRRTIERPIQARITPELVELYRTCLEIWDAGLEDIPEAEGGRRAEFDDARWAIHVGLGLKPWEYHPLSVLPDGPPEKWQDLERYAQAQALRRALDEALAAVDDPD